MQKKILYLVEKYPHKSWNWHIISSHQSITIDDIEKNMHLQWIWGENGVSKNPNLTLEFIKNHIDLPLDFGKNGISSHPNLSMETITTFPDKPWCFETLSSCKNLTLNIIKQFNDKEWNFGKNGISSHPDLAMETIEMFPDKPWCFETLSSCKNLRLNIIKQFHDKAWNWKTLTHHSPFVNGHFISTFSTKNLDYEYLSGINLSNDIIDAIKSLPDKPWNWMKISLNRSLTGRMIRNLIDMPLRFDLLSYHINISWGIIEDYPDKNWNWKHLSTYESLNIKTIEKLQDKPWDWIAFLKNKELLNQHLVEKFEAKFPRKIIYYSLNYIEENIDIIDLDKLLENKDIYENLSTNDILSCFERKNNEIKKMKEQLLSIKNIIS
jgi:hypothetical protein